ncbi:MAG: SCO6745 family protein [Dehalococcoidia bacterium]
MNNDESVQAAVTSASATLLPGPVREARPPRRLRDAFEPIAMHDVWCRQTQEQMAALGLDRLTSYVWGRAAVLGEPVAAVVVAAFGVFEPGLITAAYDRGRSQAGRTALLAARAAATAASLRTVLGEVDVVPVVTALRLGVAAADGTGRPLFSGLRALPWPDEPAGQLWRACDLLREHRGDSHLAACIGAGLDPVAMNVLTELWLGMPPGPYTATRGWSEYAIAAAITRLEQDGLVANGVLTAAGREFRDEIEQRTDAMEQPIVAAIGEDFEAVVAQLNAWSALCIEAKAFSPDVFKRAAG